MNTEVSEWFDTGKLSSNNYTHMIVVCDTFSYENYPIYVKQDQDIHAILSKYSQNVKKDMQRVLEVYKFSMEKTLQLKSGLTYNV